MTGSIAHLAFQMDPLDGIDIDADTTFILALEAHRRKIACYHFLPESLWFLDGALHVKAHPFIPQRNKAEPARFAPAKILPLDTFDLVLMRQDPPFDMAYITQTHLLETTQTLVLNDPASVRNAPEKLYVTRYGDLMPPTLITANTQAIQEFRNQHQDLIIKPLFGNGGSMVFHLTPDDENFNAVVEMFLQNSREPVMVQRYVPAVRHGDKRIILLEGKPIGAVLRVPPKGDSRANLHVGAKAVQTSLNKRDQEICDRIGPDLYNAGLVLVGIDVIGDYLTEINVTSPTGIQEINRLDDVQLERSVLDAFEKRVAHAKLQR